MRLLFLYTTLVISVGFSFQAKAQHPCTYNSKEEARMIQKALPTNALLNESFLSIKKEVDEWVGKDIDVPTPKDPAGGYTHEKHKANYILLFNSANLYQITGEIKYAQLVKNVLIKYAQLNPKLSKHPESKSSSPGRLFHQALNDANWLVYMGLAFDGIHDYLSQAERKQIAEGAFKPEVDFFTKDLNSWFNLIHNHAVWACAGVGIVGIATDNDSYVKMALYGTNLDGKTGFLANIDGLFSPDGYYTEGPYYTRYSILPFYLFANALQHSQPELKVFARRNNVLQKALTGALEQTNTDGGFYTYNDALKEKTYTCNELVEAIGIAWQVYGANPALLPIAKQQNRVTITKGGVQIAQALINKNIGKQYPYHSIQFTDGPKGDEGGVSIVRSNSKEGLTSLIYKYSSHGLSHGHFDKLNINLYDEGHEVLQDYGAVRYIGIEQKFGGRYLAETKSFAAQSIAHNALVVDEKSHYDGNEDESQKNHPNLLFSQIGMDSAVQVVSAMDDKAYANINMHRTEYLLKLPKMNKPILVDILRVLSPDNHQYDLPFQYLGTFISSSFTYKSTKQTQSTLGAKNGYQHLWKEAEAKATKPLTQFTFLNNSRFYTISSLTDDSTQLFFARIGANDPNFNLRHDPVYIIRKKGGNQAFVNIVEPHGSFDPNKELSTDAYSTVKSIQMLQNDEHFTVAEITVGTQPLLIIQCNDQVDKKAQHTAVVREKSYVFKGAFAVYVGGKPL